MISFEPSQCFSLLQFHPQCRHSRLYYQLNWTLTNRLISLNELQCKSRVDDCSRLSNFWCERWEVKAGKVIGKKKSSIHIFLIAPSTWRETDEIPEPAARLFFLVNYSKSKHECGERQVNFASAWNTAKNIELFVSWERMSFRGNLAVFIQVDFQGKQPIFCSSLMADVPSSPARL